MVESTAPSRAGATVPSNESVLMLVKVSRVTLPVAILLTALGLYRLFFVSGPASSSEYPAQPTRVVALHQHVPMVSDEELHQILRRVRPPQGPAISNNWLHAWRLWGSEATFSDPAIPDGRTMRAYFTNDDVYRQHSAPGTPPLISRTTDGLFIRTFDDDYLHRTSSSYHTDDIIATFAESGLPLDTKLKLRDGEATIAELVDSSLSRFHLQRHEFEWSIISFGRYWFPNQSWRNRYGQKVDVKKMVNALAGPRLGVGPCNGIHRLEAITVLYQADKLHQDRKAGLPKRSRLKLLRQMKIVSQLLTESQSADGFWTRRWPQGAAARADKTASIHDKILVTGHHLEWLALAPAEIHPPREQLERAARWLAAAMLEVDDKQLAKSYGPFTHAARALCLWRGAEAFPTWQRLRQLNASE